MDSDALNQPGRLDSGQRLHDLEALILVSNQINRSLDPEDVYTTSLNGIQTVIDADFGCFVLLNPDSRALELGYSYNLDSSLRACLEGFARDFHFETDIAYPDDRIHVVGVIGQRINAVLQGQAVQNSILIPLVTGSQFIGVLLFGIAGRKLLAPKSIDLLMSIGDQVAMAIENARLHASLIESEAWSRTFIENSPDAFWEGDTQGRILYVNDAACKIIGIERSTILKMRPTDLFIYADEARQAAGQALRERGVWTNPHAHIRVADGQTKDISITTRAVRDSAGELIRYQTIFRDVTAQETLLETLKQRNEELAALNSIASILANPLEIDHALDQVCQEIISITGMESAVIYLTDASGQFMQLMAHQGVSDALISQVQVIGLDDPAARMVAVEGKAIALNDLSDFASSQSFLGPRQEGYHAGVCAPIEKHGAPVGAILVGSKCKNQYAQSDVDLMLNVGRQIGTALENADLYARMQRRLLELDGLAKLGMECSTTLDPQKLSQIAVDWATSLLRTDYVIIRLLENNRMRLTASITPPGITLREYMEVDATFGPIVQKLIPLVIPNIETSDLPTLHRQGFLSTGMRSIVVTPIAARDRVIGAMAIAFQEPHDWQSHEIDLQRTIANQVASSIDSAQLFQNVMSEQRKVQAIFDSGLSGLYVTDAAGRIVMFNHVAERMTGWTLAELRDRTWDEIFRDPSQDAAVQSLIVEALLQKKTTFAQEGRKIRTRDGRIIPVAKAVAPLLDEQDNVTGAVGAFWDLSREEEVELEREEFLRLVAHQLRSPLTALLGALQLLEKPNLSKERRAEMWAIVQSDGERLRRFASQFLNLEAIVKAERAVELQRVALVPIVQSLIRRFETNRNHHHIDVKVIIPEPSVYADPDNLEHVLRNLLDNAVMYTPKDSQITVTVSALAEDRVLIQVQDEGPGIPIAEQVKIFRPFYRSPRNLGRHTYGHGLGLAIAQRMVREMGGELAVASQEGHGATFYFALRRCK